MTRWPPSLLRLHRVFGAQPAELREENLRRLVTDRIRENDDLDYKRQHYESGGRGTANIAGDIAGLANDRGGVIVLGIDEDDNEAAKELCPVDIGSDHILRIREVVARRTAPHVECDLVPVASDDNPDVGYLLIIVPPSARRPHAVVNDDNLKYPRRHGTSTRYLSESEVADMYRNRWAAARDQIEHAQQVSTEGLAATSRDDSTILSMALAPSAPGTMTVDSRSVEQVREWLVRSIGRVDYWTGFLEHPRVHVGRRRLVASASDTPPSRPPYCELHMDGAGFAATRLHNYSDRSDLARREDTRPDTPVPTIVLVHSLTLAVARQLHLLGRHALEHAGAHGDAAVLSKVTGSDAGTAVAYAVDGWVETPTRLVVLPEAQSEVTVSIDAVNSDDTNLLVSARLIANDLLNSFGIPETPLITQDGKIRRGYFGSDQRGVGEFAKDRGVALDE